MKINPIIAVAFIPSAYLAYLILRIQTEPAHHHTNIDTLNNKMGHLQKLYRDTSNLFELFQETHTHKNTQNLTPHEQIIRTIHSSTSRIQSILEHLEHQYMTNKLYTAALATEKLMYEPTMPSTDGTIMVHIL